MNNQQPGMSQPRPRQQAPLNEAQLFVLKQLQELQRQKQLGHLDQQDGRYHNHMNQLTALAKQAANNQLPAIVNGMPIHGSANYAWQNEQAGGDSRVPNNSQMYVMSNANWAQRGGYPGMQAIPEGLLSNEQGQLFRQGMVSQHNDQSSYGAHNDNTRGPFNQYSHLQGIPQDSTNALNKGSGIRLEKPVMQSLPLHNSLQGGQSAHFLNQGSMHDGTSVSRQGFQGKNVFAQVPFQGRNSGIQQGDSMHVNSISANALVQEYRGREVQAGWSGNLPERAGSQFGPSQGLVSLDPTEKKILFSTDDNSWDAPVSKSGAAGAYDNSLESEDPLNTFPSLQSGTWSALMQSAVAEASSSDTGLQDEWSGLNFPKDSSTVDQPLPVSDNNLHSASSLTSRSFPLFDDGKASQSGQASQSGRSPDFQQSGTRNLREQSERMQHDASYESMQQSLNDSGKWLDHTQQKALVQGNHQMHPSMNSRNVMQNAWTRQMQSESAGHATNMAIDSHNGQGHWVHQQRISSPNISGPHANNNTAWENNNSLAASGDASQKLRENDNSGQRLQRNDFKMGMHVEKDHSGGLMITNSLPSLMNDGSGHQVRSTMQNSSTATNQHILNSHHPNYRKHVVESPVQQREDGMVYSQKLVGSPSVQPSMYNSDRASGETYDKKQENSFQKEFSNDSYNSTQSQPTVTGGGFRENSWLSTSDSRPMASANQKSGGQAPSQQGFQGSKGHEREFYSNTEFNSHTANNAVAMEKEHIPGFQGNERGSASSDGSAGTFPPVQTCQNMLQLFHNVDQSAEHGTTARFSPSDRTLMPEAEGSDSSVARQWQNQPTASRGFGLRLGPPSQRIPVANQALNSQNSSQVVNSLNSRQMDSKVEEKGQIWMTPGASPQSLPHEISQRERWDNTPNVSGQNGNGTSQLNMQASAAAAFAASHPYSRNNIQSQQLYRTSEKSSSNPPVNVSNSRPGPPNRQTPGAFGEGDQSVLTSLPGATNRSSFVASPSDDTTSSDRATGQQYTALESVPVSRPSAVSGKTSQGDYSAMLQQVLASASAQQHLTGGLPSKGPGNFLRSSSPSGNNMERHSSPAEKSEHNDANRGLNAPEFVARSSNPQGFVGKEEQSLKENSWKQIPIVKSDLTPHRTGAFGGQESARGHPVETKSISNTSLHTHPHHQEFDRGRYGKDPAMVTQRDNPSFRSPATSTRDIEAFGRTLRPGNQNYSLLHQVQSMKSVENDLDSRGGKRFKGADGGDADVQQQLSNRAGQQLLEGRNAIARETVHSGTNAAVQHTSLSSGDAKMLNFSSERREDRNASTANNSAFGVAPSQDLSTFNRDESHNRSSQPSMSSVRSENPPINPQMAPTWFDRYGVIKPEQILPSQNAQSTVKSIPPYNFGKGSEDFVTNSSKEHLNAVDPTQITATTIVHSENLIQMQSQPLESNNLVVRPNKRKNEKPMLLPWHKEISCGSHKLQTTSMAEEDWAFAANRLVEKVEDESEFGDDGHSLVRSRKRLVYTTQLMQQILHAPAAEILSTEASSDYETVTYSVAKVALGEACGLIANSAGDLHSSIVNETQELEKLKPSEKIPDEYFSRGVEAFIGKAKKLESDLLRLDKRASVMDIRVECQDLERFSVINRFAKFHGQRTQADAESSSSQRPLPQRYVTAHAMPRNLPGGVHCLSL